MAAGSTPEQIAYISNRPDLLGETLGYVAHFMPWVRRAVVLSPASAEAELRDSAPTTIAVEVLTEESLLTAAERRELSDDHATRNASLRYALLTRGSLDDVFLQSDDDYRPFKPVGDDFFVDAGGQLIPYSFYDLRLWRKRESAYDRIQHASYLLLSYLGAETYSYAAHMPQVMDRALSVAAFDVGRAIAGTSAFCEWTLPLNFARHTAPGRYSDPRPFATICWPEYPHMWPYWQRPENVSFENFYPELYAPGHLFAGIDTALDTAAPEAQAFDKLTRWYTFDLEAGRLRFPAGVANPWIGGTGSRAGIPRRAFFSAARRARRFYEYVALEERTALRELAGAVDRLERKSGS